MIGSFLLALVSSAPAQIQAPPPRTAEIVVEGQRDLKSAASAYVDRVLPPGFQEQFGRFEDPVCPKAVGVSDANKQVITDRIREVASATNIRIAGPNCEPNLILLVVNDKKAMIADIRRHRDRYVTDVGADLLNRVANSPRPFASWQVTQMVSADNKTVGGGNNMPAGGSGASDEKGTYNAGDYNRLGTTVPASRLRYNVKPRVTVAVVIVEARALANVSTRQLADFALVRAVIPNDRHEPPAPPSSILSLLEPGTSPETAPQSVTWWDVAFLKSLMNTRSDSYADIQKSAIRNQMIREIEQGPPGQN